MYIYRWCDVLQDFINLINVDVDVDVDYLPTDLVTELKQ